MRELWKRPAPPNKKYVTRDELPGLVRRAIAEMITGTVGLDPGIVHRPTPPKNPVKFLEDRLDHDRPAPAGSIGALSMTVAAIKRRNRQDPSPRRNGTDAPPRVPGMEKVTCADGRTWWRYPRAKGCAHRGVCGWKCHSPTRK